LSSFVVLDSLAGWRRIGRISRPRFSFFHPFFHPFFHFFSILFCCHIMDSSHRLCFNLAQVENHVPTAPVALLAPLALLARTSLAFRALRTLRTLRVLSVLCFACLSALSNAATTVAVAQQLDSTTIAGMKARSIGPAGMSGRVAAIESLPSNPDIIYVGAATGGLWKSVNGGTTWLPIFDTQITSSIGAVAAFAGNPNTLWVGTGEGNVRNSAGVGRGMYKSLDAGKTWSRAGLEKTERIHRIVLHPTNPDVALVAAMGTTWGENAERGVFKTSDGGKTWRKVLYVNEKTGAAELVVDPANPNHLIAALWEHRRYPWFFNSGGAGSGIYTSYDGGETWKKLTVKDGMPEGDLGRVGIAFAPSAPNVVYALVEAKESALLRSDDGGSTWRTANKETGINPRPFYFCDIRVHPKNENKIYRLQVTLDASTDGGRSFAQVYPYEIIHPDHHALWIHPDGNIMYVGEDGGVGISRDGGVKWSFVDNLPLGQFYHVALDNDYPYNVYGGLQDNGSWRGPSNSFKSDGIYNGQWESVGFGDGFAVLPDPEDNEWSYGMSQGGNLFYSNVRTTVRKNIRPTDTDVKHRYNWNAGIALDPFNPKTVYYGSQFLHKSTDKGQTWQAISPDLTTNDPAKQKSNESGGLTRDVTAAENHCTILAIAPSAVKQDVIWVSTDDGNVQLTQDGGKSWTNVSPANSKSAVTGQRPPQGAWSPHVEASRFDAATAFVVFDDHRRSNWETFVFVTRDYGKTWSSLATKDIDGFCHVVKQDIVEPNLLFVGTEFGLFVSTSGGKNWTKWTAGFPTVPVTDMAIHPRDHDLVIATHGRGIYVLDDITPLRQLAKNAALASKPLHLFELGKGSQFKTDGIGSGSYVSAGHALYRGEQRRFGAFINYFLNPADSVVAKEGTPKEQKITIEILSIGGAGGKDTTTLRTLKGPMRKGLNRATWEMSRRAYETPSRTERSAGGAGGMGGGRRGGGGDDDPDFGKMSIPALPGTYYVRMKHAGTTALQPIQVEADPRQKTSTEALAQRDAMMNRTGALLESVAKACKQILSTKRSIKAVSDAASASSADKSTDKATKTAMDSLVKQGKSLDTKLDSLLDDMVPEESRAGGIFDRSQSVVPMVYEVLFRVLSSNDAPSQAAQAKYDKAKPRVQSALAKVNALYASDVAAFKKAVEASNVSLWSKTETLELKE
jgi:photosystem II stability/assembly factor-like uncharacterized protein